MNVYNYHPHTHQFLNISEADKDPLEVDTWLIPAFATLIAPPPAPPSQVAVFNTEIEAWALVFKEATKTTNARVPTLDEQRHALVNRIYAEIDAITFATVGHRTQEYLMAEQDATAFQTAGYEGVAPESVQGAADAFGVSTQQAADEILQQAEQWRTAQALMRRKRLWYKTRVLAGTESELPELVEEWTSFISEIQAMLAGR